MPSVSGFRISARQGVSVRLAQARPHVGTLTPCPAALCAVIKPIYGAASIGVVKVTSMEGLQKTYKQVRHLVGLPYTRPSCPSFGQQRH